MQIIRKQFFLEKKKREPTKNAGPLGACPGIGTVSVFSMNLFGSRGTSDGYIYLSDNRVGDTLSL